ncbi:Fibrinogen-like protein A,Ficolin-1,Angiopoietin-related protein 7,Ficolin-2,Tenascin [Mytilus coruscus]|uniref:Fibrinogen-like protein A,Ficolin-1,Angiopoietin-related protein 7,Ficolin-2,Tenascin n=1 Tax=Mytilus coruscus TaxID=42192 RepID=A0A6J8DA01_MYTCO|nr:Fibrinogen-like protein A,Ficolin-1,Angiopoietin-related protein 7,Ficolin-2,Tenascin [Mytilus coruscus]
MQIVIYLICVLYEATWAEKNVLTSASESGVYFYGETAERVMNILLKGNQRNILPSVSRPKDCSYLDKKLDKSGVYKIYPDNGTGFDVFVNRMDGSESFNRKWKDYENGFGNLKKEFWLGNTNLQRLTSRVNTEMRVEMKNFKGEKRFAKYSMFKVGDAASKYKLTVKGFTGNAGDAMKYHNGLAFSTKDKDNDRNRSGNCAQTGG